MTRVRLPDTPIPRPERDQRKLDGEVPEMVGLLQCHEDAESVIARAAALGHRCPEVIVVDQGSSQDCRAQLHDAGLRVLRLPVNHGEGAALRAGMQLARELGYIGALLAGPEIMSADDVDVLAFAHLRAPEAMVMGVGPGEAVAGQEWLEASLLAEGLELPARSDFRPPRAGGLIGQVEHRFEKLVETRFAHPWGSPRVLPLQAMLRRDLRCEGLEFHMECLFLAVLAGVPTLEVELGVAPGRRVLTCRRVGAKLLARILMLTASKRLSEGMGMGGGYAPPTTSPLALLLAAGLAVVALVPCSGCVHNAAPLAPDLSCEQQWSRDAWPGAGDAQLAWQALSQERSARGDLWMAQSVTLDAPGPAPAHKLNGALVLGGSARFRLRLVAPMGGAVLDFVRSGDRWQLIVPSIKLKRSGQGPLPALVESTDGEQLPLRLDLLGTVLLGTSSGSSVAWQTGRCGVLEEFDAQGALLRRLAWNPDGVLVREEFIEDGEVLLAASYSDYRMVSAAVSWPHLIEMQDLQAGGSLVLQTGQVLHDPLGDEFFAMTEPAGQQVSRE